MSSFVMRENWAKPINFALQNVLVVRAKFLKKTSVRAKNFMIWIFREVDVKDAGIWKYRLCSITEGKEVIFFENINDLFIPIHALISRRQNGRQDYLIFCPCMYLPR
jgi:hypothetical protein